MHSCMHVLDDALIDRKKRISILEQAKANIVRAQQKQKQAYDKKHCNPKLEHWF